MINYLFTYYDSAISIAHVCVSVCTYYDSAILICECLRVCVNVCFWINASVFVFVSDGVLQQASINYTGV